MRSARRRGFRIGDAPGRRAALSRAIRTIIYASVGVAFVAGIAVGPRVMRVFRSSKTDIARATAMKYALEAYPAFREASPDRTCPRTLAELNEWMNNKDTRDPWGQHYLMDCNGERIVVRSSGEDRILDTADDLRSDR